MSTAFLFYQLTIQGTQTRKYLVLFFMGKIDKKENQLIIASSKKGVGT